MSDTDRAASESTGGLPSSYLETRYTPDPHRRATWAHIVHHLERWIPPTSRVLELGAGYCDFSNNLTAQRRVAMDTAPNVKGHVDPGVEPEVGDCTDLGRFDDESFDVVFASNLLEHLTREQSTQLLHETRRVLAPGGRLILLQPNFRLRPGEYFDDYTHVQIFTDRSLPDFLIAEGYTVREVVARFLPLTMKSRFSGLTFLVPWYLKSPVKPMAGQMLVVAERPVKAT
ncbi:MAG: methyltransferase domain-containing protein [Acidimicrobiia bacterium]